MKNKLKTLTIFSVCYIALVILVLVAYDTWIVYKQNHPPQESAVQPTMPVEPTPTTAPKLKVHTAIPYWEQREAIASLKTNVEDYDSISMFWYYLNADYEVSPYRDADEDESIIAYAHEHNIKVLALITNLPDFENSEWSSDRVRPLIATKQTRAKHIRDLIQVMDKKKFDGINIDYEELDDDLRDEFSLFINELSTELHKRGKIVGVALHPKSGEGIQNEDNGSRAQDWQALGSSADHLYIMAYGEHWNTSAAGPPASISWDTNIINYARELSIPAEKIYFGVPLYGVRWEVNKKEGEGYVFSEIEQIRKKYTVQPQWDEKAKTPYLRYAEDGKQYELWFENARSVREKIDLVKQNELGGITLWHIGGEDPAVRDLF